MVFASIFPGHLITKGGTTIQRVNGNKFMYLNNMTGALQIYRFNGEIAIPCGRVTANDIWYDANGNGNEDTGESTTQSLGECRAWWADSQGTIWAAQKASNAIYKFPVQSVNASGVPQYTTASKVTYCKPAGSSLTEFRRIRYYPAEDALYLGGGNASTPAQHWKPMGPVLERWNNWSSTSPIRAWAKPLPYVIAAYQHESYEPGDFDVAGDYVFVGWVGSVPAPYNFPRGTVGVYRKSDASLVGYFCTPIDFAKEHLGIMDICQALKAYKRSNGEYLVFLEEDGRSKNTMFRWCPTGNCSSAPGPGADLKL